MANMFDTEPEHPPQPLQIEPWRPDRVPSDVETALGAMVALTANPYRFVKATRNAARAAVRVARRFRDVHPQAGMHALRRYLDDPVARLLSARDSMSGAKQLHSDIGHDTLQELSQLATPAFFMPLARFYTSFRMAERHRPIHGRVERAGPRFPLFLAGAKLVASTRSARSSTGAGSTSR